MTRCFFASFAELSLAPFAVLTPHFFASFVGLSPALFAAVTRYFFASFAGLFLAPLLVVLRCYYACSLLLSPALFRVSVRLNPVSLEKKFAVLSFVATTRDENNCFQAQAQLLKFYNLDKQKNFAPKNAGCHLTSSRPSLIRVYVRTDGRTLT